MKILVLNAWSSSLKYQLLEMPQNSVVAKWIVGKVWEKWSSVKNHTEALQSVLDTLSAHWTIDAIGHRVVHGGEYFKNPVIVTDDVIAKITECSDLAPLHNPANLQAILACKELLPKVPQVAVFDTAFYQGMTPEHYLYALPMKYYEQYKIRRYGFHWTSHQYVYEQLITNYELRITNSKIPKKNFKVITCHVGNGVSITAIKDGKVIETSMGMTPLEGLMMWTRSGNIDPAIIFHLHKYEKLSDDTIEHMLEYESWLLGVSGVSSDMRDILAGIEKWNKQCVLALDMYINSFVKYIWAYAALLWWIDVIVLTAGIMEHRAVIRTKLFERLAWMWVVLDDKANQDDPGSERVISTPDSKVIVVIIPTNEEYMIAKETFKLVNN